MPKPIVSIQKCGSYSLREAKEAIEKSLAPLGGIKSIIKPNEKILLKVNSIGPHAPEKAATTHPTVVRAVAQLVKEAGAEPVIADMAFVSVAPTKRALEKSGLKAIGEKEGIPILALETEGFQKAKINGKVFSELFVSLPWLNADKVIFVPKLKTHMDTELTAAVKLSFGFVPMLYRMLAHSGSKEYLCNTIVDVFSVRKPDLVVMDAIIGMDGNGPTRGRPKQLGLVISSNDAVAADTVAEKLIGFGQTLTTKIAAERGLGENSLDRIKIVGEKIDEVGKQFRHPITQTRKLPAFFRKLFVRLSMVLPAVKKECCTRCLKCVEYCPPKAIAVRSYPEISSGKCIQCFGCAELCPNKAIERKHSKIYGPLSKIRELIRI